MMEIGEEAPQVEPVGFSMNEGWSSTAPDGSTNNILYIAVEYVKDDLDKLGNEASLSSEVYTEFQDDVSPLDPNMSSVARYSPVYKAEPRVTYNNPVVLTQLITSEANVAETPIITEAIGGDALEQVVSNPYLLTDQNIVANPGFKIENDNNGEEVDILITDQSTGISYLVERCLADDSQLLDSDPLMDSDLLALDDAALKSQLSKIIVEEPVLVDFATSKTELNNLNAKTEPRPQRQLKKEEETEEQLLACVQQISDKPILSRAKATLPESHLVISKIFDGGLGVFAKKFIPKRTQFGPIEGIVVPNEVSKNDIFEDGVNVHLSIETHNNFKVLNVSNEDASNWMCFVRLAQSFKEQNLVLTQFEGNLYYTTIKNIHPKQELKVFYGASYASARNLKVLEPEVEEDDLWDCYECSKKFTSYNLLQKHLDEHDREMEQKTGKKKRKSNNIIETSEHQKFKCNICSEEFKSPKYDELQQHLKHHGINGKTDLRDVFVIVIDSKAILSYIKNDSKGKGENKTHKCPVCYKTFASEERIQRHMLVHGSEEMKPLQCDKCQKRFLNNSALTCHLKTHLFGSKVFECPICKESFQHVLQLKMHVPKHCIDGRYTCPLCLKVFEKYNIIRKHIRGFHCERKHPCPDCGKQFATVDKLRMHLLKHSDHREFLCSDCGKQFKRKDKLKEHCKRMHLEERENAIPRIDGLEISRKKFKPKVLPTDFNRFIYKCHTCLLGFKRRGMLVNHLAKRHPDISRDTVPELNLPILKATKDYYCNYCEKVYKSSSKRKAHILKNHPGGVLPLSNRHLDSAKLTVLPNPTFSATVGSVTTHPHSCKWCHKQYASKAKLLQHQRKKHTDLIDQESPNAEKMNEDDIMGDIVQQDGHYYQFVSMDGVQFDQTDLEGESRLCKLLSSESNLVPPR